MYSSMELSDQGTKYILPLDALDLTYLPVFRRSDKTVPLWTPSDDKYFEFEVLQTVQELNTERDQKDNPQAAEEKLELSTYIKILNSITEIRPPLFTLRAVDEETVEIKLNNKKKVYIPIDNFHGYYEVGGTTLCRLCLTSTIQKETHKLNQKHMGLVMAPINDVHCIRQIDHLWSHCMVCNDTIQDREFHLTCSTGHDSRLRDALGTNNIYTTKEPVKTTLTNNVLNNYIINKAKDRDTEKQDTTEKHQNAGTLANTNKKIVTDKKIETPSTSSQSCINTIVHYCDICDMKMHVNNLRSHLNGKIHKEKQLNANQKKNETKKGDNKNTLITSKLPPKTSQNIQSNVVRCCGLEVHKNNLSTHLNGRYHKERQIQKEVENAINTTSAPSNNNNTSNKNNNTEHTTCKNKNVFICCDRKLPLNNIHNINAHLKSTTHKNNLNLKPDDYFTMIAKIQEINNKNEKVQSAIPSSLNLNNNQNSSLKHTETKQEQSKAAKNVDERIKVLVSKERNKMKVNADENSKKNMGNIKNVLPGTSRANVVPKPLTRTNAEMTNNLKPAKTEQGINAIPKIQKMSEQNSQKILGTALNSFKLSIQEQNVSVFKIDAGQSNKIQVVKTPTAENLIKDKETNVNTLETEKEINERIKNMIARERKKIVPQRKSHKSNEENKQIEEVKPNKNPNNLVQPQAKVENVIYSTDHPKQLDQTQAKIDKDRLSDESPENLIQPLVNMHKDKRSYETPKDLIIPQANLEKVKPSNENPTVSLVSQDEKEIGDQAKENPTPKIEKNIHCVETPKDLTVAQTQKVKEYEKSLSNENTKDIDPQQIAKKKENAIFDRIRNMIAKARGKNKKTAEK